MLVAAGRGERLGAGAPKQFRALAGRPLFAHSLRLFDALAWVERIALVLPPGGLPADLRDELTLLRHEVRCVEGGARRQDSVAAGLAALCEPAAGLPSTSSLQPPASSLEVVLVHDVARPFAEPALIERLARVALESGGGLLAARAADTVKRARAGAGELGGPPRVAETLDRRTIWLAQTPQAIRGDLVARAIAELRRPDLDVTDEAMLLESWGIEVALVESPPENFKITTAADFARAAALMSDPTRAATRS